MKALVVYESMFGNTEKVARAIGAGLARHGQVNLQEVGQLTEPLPADLDLLVVGGPTHAFGMSRPGTRQSASQQTPSGLISQGIGIREWVEGLARPEHKIFCAVFDTKIGKPMWLPGSAARAAAKRLRQRGFPPLVVPKSFYVTGTTGPLAEGELARAREWGEAIAALLPVRTPSN
jgi:hypothetical protein